MLCEINDDGKFMKFELLPQGAFAQLSGDFNPIHMDPVYARRSPYGQVAHGVNVAVSCIEGYFSESEPIAGLESIFVNFISPVAANSTCEFSLSHRDDCVELEVNCGGVPCALIRLRFADEISLMHYESLTLRSSDFKPSKPVDVVFSELSDCELTLDNEVYPPSLASFFPSTLKAIGLTRLSAILSLTRFVGMHCPGLNSLFSSFDIQFSEHRDKTISFVINRPSNKRLPITAHFDGAGIQGTLKAFFRPDVVLQPSVEDCQRSIRGVDLSGQKCLVLGGSRGLGELVAKVSAAAGARVAITYAVGAADAEDLASTINLSTAGSCVAFNFDVEKNIDSQLKLIFTEFSPDVIYYFCSPRIVENKRAEFQQEIFETYEKFYVASFLRVLTFCSRYDVRRIIFPSTDFLNYTNRNFKEYCLAKALGEVVCEKFGANIPDCEILYPRLPRVHTDQTQGFILAKFEDSLSVVTTQLL